MAAAKESRVLRFFGVEGAEVRRAAEGLTGRCGLEEVACRSQGRETLLALAAPPPGVRKAEGLGRRQFGAGLYGAGGDTLAAAAAAALVEKDRRLACADTLALELLSPRLEGQPGIDRVFDFGAGSCADGEARARIDAQARRCKGGREAGPLWDELCRLRAVLRVTRADLAVGALAVEDGTLVLAAGRRGSWVYLAAPGENAALWLLDLVRRAALGAAQADGVRFILHGEGFDLTPAATPVPRVQAVPDTAAMEALLAADGEADPVPARTRPGRWPARVAFLLAVLLLAGLAAAFQATGGDLAALPDVLRSLAGAPDAPSHAGATFL